MLGDSADRFDDSVVARCIACELEPFHNCVDLHVRFDEVEKPQFLQKVTGEHKSETINLFAQAQGQGVSLAIVIERLHPREEFRTACKLISESGTGKDASREQRPEASWYPADFSRRFTFCDDGIQQVFPRSEKLRNLDRVEVAEYLPERIYGFVTDDGRPSALTKIDPGLLAKSGPH